MNNENAEPPHSLRVGFDTMELRATQLKKKIAAEVSKRLPCVRGAVSRRLTEGLPPHQRFASMADRCSRSPNYVSAPQISTAPKTTLLTGSSGIGEATFFAPDRSFSDLSKFQLRKSILQPRFARQLPLHKGAYFLASATRVCFGFRPRPTRATTRVAPTGEVIGNSEE